MKHVEVMLVGSANMDLVVRATRFPLPGETLQGSEFQRFPGGKGANQATAAGKLGADVGIIAKLGSDSFGDELVASLASAGVHTNWVLRDPAVSTGVALITVDDSGQNTIVVSPGTNALLAASEVESVLRSVSAKVVLAQLEIPIDTVCAASRVADNAIFILNPAPARDLPGDLLNSVDYLTPNETEAEELTGILPTDDATCLAAARVLFDKGVKNVLFTLGARGSYLATPKQGHHFPAIRVKPVDTTGAGDAFNGALAHFLASGEEISRAIHLANVTGALSTTRPGAQASMPSLKDVISVAD